MHLHCRAGECRPLCLVVFSRQGAECTAIYICIYVCVCVYLCIHRCNIFIYGARSKAGLGMHLDCRAGQRCMYTYTYMYIYMGLLAPKKWQLGREPLTSLEGAVHSS